MPSTPRKTCLAAALCAVMFAGAAIAQTRDFDVPAGDLSAALDAYVRQSGVQLIYRPQDVRGVSSRGLQGAVPVEQALRQILEGTGFAVERDETGAIAIVREGGTNEQQRSRPGANVRSDAAELGTILVVGSRLKTGGDQAPVTVFNREDIDQMGVGSVSDVMNRLPQQTVTDLAEIRTAGSAVFAELRGLGSDASLVLVNGRRAVPSGPTVQFNAVDLNAIPLSAVERIEVLSGSASAIYGTDALGGVVNIVLKRDLPRAVVDLRYGGADGGATERRISFGSGYSTERMRTTVLLDYFERDPLMGDKRALFSDMDFRRFGSIDRRSLASNPGTIRSLTTDNLPGLSSRIAAVPQGSTGVGLTPADFVATAGQQNYESPNRFRSITSETERRSVFATVEFDITPQLAMFGEAMYADRVNTVFRSPSTLTAVVPETNPFNPFGVAVSASYHFTGVGPIRSIDEGESYRAVLGLRGASNSWDWEVSVLDTKDKGKGWTENSVNSARAVAALNAVDPALALNVFQDGPGGSAALLQSLVQTPTIREQLFDATQLSGFVRGPLFVLPAGDVEIVLGAEARREEMQAVSGSPFTATRDVSALFSEVRVPLVGESMGVPAVRELSLTVASRYDDYSDFGGTFNPQYGLVLQPSQSLLLRAAYGTSFRAPSMFELFSPAQSIPGYPVPDPRRGETASVTAVLGGSPDLKPIEGKSWSVGFTFSPTNLDALKVSASYWRIDLDERVSVIQPADLVAYEDMFPERIQREQPTPEDTAAGIPGRLIGIRSTYQNFGRLRTSGVDAAISHSIDTALGRFSPSILATWVKEHSSFNVPGLPMVDRVGIANALGTIPEWRAVATLGWKFKALGVSATARYTSPVDDVDILSAATGRTLPSQVLFDVQGSVDFDHGTFESTWLKGLSVSFGVSNLLDRQPTFAEVSPLAGYDISVGDLRGRFGYLALSKSF